MKKTRVLVLSSTNNVLNGYGNITHELAMFLNKHVEFKLLLPVTSPHFNYSHYPVEYLLPEYIFSAKTLKFLDYITFATTYSSQFDIVHSLVEFPYMLLGAALAKRFHKPLVVSGQGTYAVKPLSTYPEKFLVTWAYNSSVAITVPSQYTKNRIQGLAKIEAPIHIIHNGVNFSRFQKKYGKADIKRRWPRKSILLSVGGLKTRKGQDLVFRALAQIKESLPPFQYLVIGDGSERKKYQQMVHDLGLGNNVTLLGEISGTDLVKYFQSADVFILTPRVSEDTFEGFGIVYLEASACGKPVIATNSGGVSDAVIHNKTGLIVPEEDVNTIASAIIKLLSSPKLRNMLGKNGLSYAREHDWNIIGDKFLNLYGEVINKATV